ncbi:hypothetical protein LCGC14_2722810 [marine sediment metagenome]|uniref:HTH cro/C1-type domain-containing protein n=1 Tax=marine sediment metagenome TaxID=412755 RepID=A0A0F8Z9K3_9ZZZZ
MNRMNAQEFTQLGEGIQRRFTGKSRGWQSTLAFQLGLSVRTIRRYTAGDSKIPEPVARLLTGLAA